MLLADMIYTPDRLSSAPRQLSHEDADQNRFLQILVQARDERAGIAQRRDLAVEPLTLAESRELALDLMGRDDTISRAHAHIIARESQGNPLFINELVKYLQNRGSIGRLGTAPPTSSSRPCSGIASRLCPRMPGGCSRWLPSRDGRSHGPRLAFRTAEPGAGGRVALGHSCARHASFDYRAVPARRDRNLS